MGETTKIQKLLKRRAKAEKQALRYIQQFQTAADGYDRINAELDTLDAEIKATLDVLAAERTTVQAQREKNTRIQGRLKELFEL